MNKKETISRIRNRLPESKLNVDYRSKVKSPYRLSLEESTNLNLNKEVDGEVLTPIQHDWFGVYLLSDIKISKSETLKPVLIYTEDDFLNMDTDTAKNYLKRFLRTNKTIRLNHLLNLPESVKQLVSRKDLAQATVQLIMGNLLAQELLLRIVKPKSKAVSAVTVVGSPITTDVLNLLEFDEIFLHKIVPKKVPQYLKELLGLENGKRYTTSSGVVYDIVCDTLSTTELAVESYRNSNIGNFMILGINKGVRIGSKSTGEAQVVSLTPKKVFGSLPPINTLFSEAERINRLWSIFVKHTDAALEQEGIDKVAKDKGVRDIPRKALYSTNPMYGAIVNKLFDETYMDLSENNPYFPANKLRVLAELMDAGLFDFEVTTKSHAYSPWNGVQKLKSLNGQNYSSRINGSALTVSAFISPYLQNMMWIMVAMNDTDMTIRNHKASWDHMYAQYLSHPSVSNTKEILADALYKVGMLARFVDRVRSDLGFFDMSGTVPSEVDGKDIYVGGVNVMESIYDLPSVNDDLKESPLHIGDFTLSDLA